MRRYKGIQALFRSMPYTECSETATGIDMSESGSASDATTQYRRWRRKVDPADILSVQIPALMPDLAGQESLTIGIIVKLDLGPVAGGGS